MLEPKAVDLVSYPSKAFLPSLDDGCVGCANEKAVEGAQ